MLQIELDKKKLQWSVGDYSSSLITVKPLSENNLYIKKKALLANGYTHEEIKELTDLVSYKKFHKFTSSVLGPKFNLRLSASCSNLWGKHKDTLYKYYIYMGLYCPYLNEYHWGKLSLHNDQVRRFLKHEKKINKVIEDGLYNIVPLVTYFGAEPKELKQKLGKGVWGRLANNSLSFNKKIVTNLDDFIPKLGRTGTIRNYEPFLEPLSALISIKKTLVTQYRWLYHAKINKSEEYIFSQLRWLSDNSKVTNNGDVSFNADIYRDTRSMAMQLNESFNSNWSKTKMRKQHDRYSKILLSKDYPDIAYPWLEHVQEEWKLKEYPQISVALVKTPFELYQEGFDMDHCVASYDAHISKGNYMVFSLSLIGQKYRTTLGLTKIKNKWGLHQHYGKHNQPVIDDAFLNLAKAIVNAVNKGKLNDYAI